MKQLLISALLLLATTTFAIPAKRIVKTIIVNGSEVTVTLTGDEFLHYWQGNDGKVYKQKSDGSFEQTELKAKTRSAENDVTRARFDGRQDPIIGERCGLVILVNTQDVKFSCSEDVNATYTAMMNEIGYSEGTATGSVREYFLDQSFGKLDYKFDVVGPVTVSQNMAYYGSNDRFEYEACCVGEMIVEALQLIDDEVDFTKYDMDGDGEVENIYIIYAGYAESDGNPDAIWPHAYDLKDINWWNKAVNVQYCDGVKINNYACGSEFRGTKGGKIDGIGTFCHEFSHCLGIPDFYNVSNPSKYTLGYWDLMDIGCYNNDGDTPPSYTAYERWLCGWLDLVELTEDTEITGLRPLDDGGVAYIYYNEANNKEYYILQNIQKTGWNKYVNGHGLAVLHVDYNSIAWYSNSVNSDPNHLRMSLFCADNTRTIQSESGDLYPSVKNGNDSLTNTSKPAAKVFTKNIDGKAYMGKYLYDIAENEDGEISFTYKISQSLKDALDIDIVELPESDETLLYNINGQKAMKDDKLPVITSDGKKIILPAQ